MKARASSVPQLPCPWAEPTLSWADLLGLDLGLTPPDLHSESLGPAFVESQARPWHQLPPLASNLALAERRYPPCKDKPGATPRKMSWLSLQTEHSGTATLPKGCHNINGPHLQGMEGWGGGRHTHTLTHTHCMLLCKRFASHDKTLLYQQTLLKVQLIPAFQRPHKSLPSLLEALSPPVSHSNCQRAVSGGPHPSHRKWEKANI